MPAIRIFGTEIKAKASVLPNLLALGGVVVWLGQRRHPGRKLGKGLLVGLVSALLLLLADIGHAVAHILSARLAGAPMDELLISAGMPRTLYSNNEVSTDTHRMRAIGGPVYNAVGLLLSAISYRALARRSFARELAGWSALGHGLLLVGSLAPVPVVDGGSLLKFTLVSRGRTPAQADEDVRRVDWALAVATGLTGAGFLARRGCAPGLVLLAASALIAAITAGKIR